MTPRQIRSLLTVLAVGSVNRAASTLHLAPSSVSAQLKELSSELGVELFQPLGRQIIPTAACKELQPLFEQFLALEQDMHRVAEDFVSQPSGPLKVFAPSSMCIYRLPDLINALKRKAQKVELHLINEPFDVHSAFDRSELEAAILVSQSFNPDWCCHPLYRERIIYVCHPDRFVAHSLKLSALQKMPLITTEAGCSYRLAAEEHFKRQGLQLKPQQSFSNVEVLKRCLLSDFGIGLLPECVVQEELMRGDLCELRVEGTPYVFQSALVYPAQRVCSKALQALIEVIESASPG